MDAPGTESPAPDDGGASEPPLVARALLNHQSIVPLHAHTRALRICILDVAAAHTVDREFDAKDAPVAASTSAASTETDTTESAHKYPHDAHVVLRQMYPDAQIDIFELQPDFRKTISVLRRLERKKYDLFVNLYDLSDETGQRVVDFLEQKAMAFTGAGSRFYDPTRDMLKIQCRFSDIDTPLYLLIDESATLASDADAERVVAELGGFPLFIKPQHGFDSVGIDCDSIVHTLAALRARVDKMIDEWGSALVEKFVDGREFSVLIVGNKERAHVYTPVEYVFDAARAQQGSAFITFEDKWVSYENRWRLLDVHSAADAELAAKIESIARRLLIAFEGEGYARIDIRQDRFDQRLHVLDVNPNCSVFYRDSCTADSIADKCGVGKVHLMHQVIDHAWRRQARQHAMNKTEVKYLPKRGFALHAVCAIAAGEVVYSDEMNMLRVVTRTFAEKHWNAQDLANFDRYAWPVGPNTFAIWSPDPQNWKPINHSCDPNCWMHGLETHARRAIAAGEELTLDYSIFEPYHPPFQCWCGTRECIGMIVPNRHTDAAFVAKYAGHCSPFMEHLIEMHQRGERPASTAIAAATGVATSPDAAALVAAAIGASGGAVAAAVSK